MMKKLVISLSLVLVSSVVMAYQDSDIDGIGDSVDQCPNTPLNAFVDSLGCEKSISGSNEEYFKQLTLSMGTTLQRDSIYEDNDVFNFYANYRFDVWDISLSNIRSGTKSNYTEDNSQGDNDFYLSLGHMTYMDSASIRLTAGVKVVDDSAQRDNDYFAALNYDYFIGERQDIFLLANSHVFSKF